MREGGDVFPIKAGQLHHSHHHGHAPQQPLVLDPVSALDGSVNKIKPSQQIPITTFWNYVEPFFKPIAEADLKALQEAPPMDPAPYIIPPLGRHYREQWADEDRQLMGASGGSGAGTGVTESGKKASKPKKGSAAAAAAAAAEDVVSFPPELLCRPLTEKLMAAMIEDDETTGGQSATIASAATAPASTAAATEVNSDADEGSTMDREPSLIESCEEMYDMEERLKRELRFIGLLPDEEVGTTFYLLTYDAHECIFFCSLRGSTTRPMKSAWSCGDCSTTCAR